MISRWGHLNTLRIFHAIRINFQAQINYDRELQASLRAQGWGCQETDQEMLPRQKRDLEEEGTQQQGNNVRV